MAASEAGAREHFATRAGFVLAAIGSAVGLGNMWRFSYLAAENGGAAFVLLYVAPKFSCGSDSPAAIAWPPNLLISPGCRAATASSASRI